MLRHLSEIQYGPQGVTVMVTRRVIAICLVAVALCVQVCGAEMRKVWGRVVDVAGQPVAGAEVATIWDGVGGTAMRAFHAARADQAGRFTIDVNFWQGHEPFLAYNREHTRGGIVIWISRPREPERAPACRDFSSHVMRAPMKPAGTGTIQGSPATHLQTPPRDI